MLSQPASIAAAVPTSAPVASVVPLHVGGRSSTRCANRVPMPAAATAAMPPAIAPIAPNSTSCALRSCALLAPSVRSTPSSVMRSRRVAATAATNTRQPDRKANQNTTWITIAAWSPIRRISPVIASMSITLAFGTACASALARRVSPTGTLTAVM